MQEWDIGYNADEGSKKEKSILTDTLFLFGALNRNRTDDLILTMDALYRLSYEGR